MMKEIGSEFWEYEKSDFVSQLNCFNIGKDERYLMSGQTAIDYVIKNLNDSVKIVYMPDYCCESMINPFYDNGYEVKFYKVDLINMTYEINEFEKCSVFYAMSYFGYSMTNMDDYINKIKSHGIIVIEDITHRLFQKNNYCKSADYLVASLRKWVPIYCGGIAISMNNKFKISCNNYFVDKMFLDKRRKAMHLKKMYMNNLITDKSEYLRLYQESNELLLEYSNKMMDEESLAILRQINFNEMIETRRKNVMLIEKMVKNNPKIKLLFNLTEDDCPLFVPVLINNREVIRQELIKNEIYCPVHWPNFNKFNNSIYLLELSLVCDQRYKVEDIEKYMTTFIEFVERN